MQVILLEDVDTLGDKGELADVARGYARNYLIPRRLAEVATPGKVAEVRRRMEERRAREVRSSEQAIEAAEVLNKTVLTLTAHAGEGEKLYGSVTTSDIAEAIWGARKLRIDKRKIRLDEPIKTVGTHLVDIDVFEGVDAQIKIIVIGE
jgi:large subunit ribosomal protein L9